jgi:hypothetical protein
MLSQAAVSPRSGTPEPFVSADEAAEFLCVKRRYMLELAGRGIVGAHALGTGTGDPTRRNLPSTKHRRRSCELRTESDARRALEALRLNINLDPSEQARPRRNFKMLVDHYRLKELALRNNERQAYSTKKAYRSYLKNWIIVPR